jgi:hypothetical protein
VNWRPWSELSIYGVSYLADRLLKRLDTEIARHIDRRPVRQHICGWPDFSATVAMTWIARPINPAFPCVI